MPRRSLIRSTIRACTCASLVALVALMGCQRQQGPTPSPLGRTTVSVNGRPVPSEDSTVAPNAPSPLPLEHALKSDPCAARLHEISGAMLTYHALHGRLPADLDQLKSVQGPLDPALNFTCPATGQPYVYVPAGLRSPDDPRQVVLHDRSPDPTGQRWVILLQPPRARQAAATWVLRLPEPAFKAYASPVGTTRPAKSN